VAVVEAEQQAIHARGKLYVTDKTVREMFPDLPYKRCVDCHHVKALVTEFPKVWRGPHAVRTCSECTSDKKRSRTHNGALT
jgi:hypothetical protein